MQQKEVLMMAELSSRLQESNKSRASSQLSEEHQQILDQHITEDDVNEASCSSDKNFESKGNYDSNTINNFQS